MPKRGSAESINQKPRTKPRQRSRNAEKPQGLRDADEDSKRTVFDVELPRNNAEQPRPDDMKRVVRCTRDKLSSSQEIVGCRNLPYCPISTPFYTYLAVSLNCRSVSPIATLHRRFLPEFVSQLSVGLIILELYFLIALSVQSTS